MNNSKVYKDRNRGVRQGFRYLLTQVSSFIFMSLTSSSNKNNTIEHLLWVRNGFRFIKMYHLLKSHSSPLTQEATEARRGPSSRYLVKKCRLPLSRENG